MKDLESRCVLSIRPLSNCSDEGLTLKRSAFQTFNSGNLAFIKLYDTEKTKSWEICNLCFLDREAHSTLNFA